MASREKLPAVIETLTAAARAGELDEILTQASKQRPFQKSRKRPDTPIARGHTALLSPAHIRSSDRSR